MSVKIRQTVKYLLWLLAFLLLGPLLVLLSGTVTIGGHWSDAARDPTGIAPSPASTQEAVIQVYAARAFSWRGAFGVHTWLAAKRHSASAYKVYQVLSWRQPVVVAEYDAPDRLWYNQPPTLLREIRGREDLIDQLEAAVHDYPYRHAYRIWPGPNSNTFTAFVARQVPELGVELPPTAIGKDYLGAAWFATTPSGSGGQLSLYGLFGIAVSKAEGLEINLLGLNFGVDPLDVALKMPGLGRVALISR
jgi:hypothetical protein